MKGPLSERLWAKVEKTDGCWLWRGAKNRGGYGVIHVKHRSRLAHRISYELLVGAIPAGLHIDHLCRTPSCVNPAHMEPVTLAENTRRGVPSNSRKTHCPQGHPYDHVNKIGARRCSTCLREQRRAYKQRQRSRIVGEREEVAA